MFVIVSVAVPPAPKVAADNFEELHGHAMAPHKTANVHAILRVTLRL
jgi:hypothetical protein